MRFDIQSLNSEFEKKSPQEILAWASETFGEKVTLASSFGAEDVVLIDVISKLPKRIQVFTLDTGRLNEETYDVMERIRRKYRMDIISYFPEREKVEALEREKGFFSFKNSIENRKECCGIRKVEPLGRALKGLEAWVTGLRREQSVTRTDTQILEVDSAHNNIYKINPLADWTQDQVFEYILKYNVPFNRLHDLGYPSIGCAPCTRAIAPGEDARAGRWWWENPEHKECGLHLPRPGKDK